MRIALALLVMLGACRPDYSDTAFVCDSTKLCPQGQLCIGNRCRRGGAAGPVACGPAGACTIEQQCCVDTTNPPRCIPAGDQCPGFAALCDGPADCQAGDACCDDDVAYCKADCGTASILCTVDVDCPSGYPHCCPYDPLPWGYCQFDVCTP